MRGKPIKTWTMTQKWEHLVFAHWPVEPEIMRKFVPDALEIDTFGGKAWIGIISFLMNSFKLKYVPIPYPFSFPEINIRTYVKANGSPGIFFMTLDAADPWVVHVARRWYHLPYYNAEMSFSRKDGQLLFQSKRKKPAPYPEMFHGEFHPASHFFVPREGTIAHWLTERYVFFTKASRNDHVYWGEVYHEPWTLQTAQGHISANTMLQSSNITLAGPPHYLHYSRGVEALIGRIHTFDNARDQRLSSKSYVNHAYSSKDLPVKCK